MCGGIAQFCRMGGRPWKGTAGVIGIVMLVSTVVAWTDAASAQPVPGSNLMHLMIHPGIRMEEETIWIRLFEERVEVVVEYTFKNEGQWEETVMGFPNRYVATMHEPIEDFRAFEGGRELEVFRSELQSDSDGERQDYRREWLECFRVVFGEGEQKLIRNSYTQSYGVDYENTKRRFAYILTTGAMWKGPIGFVRVIAQVEDETILDAQERMAYFSYAHFDTWGRSLMPGFAVSPAAYQRQGNTVEMSFQDVEPDFDIQITLPVFSSLYRSATASSELADDRVDYSPSMAIDGDPATAWVEGAIGAGIGESLSVWIGPYVGKMVGCYGVKRIGIINGYAQDEKLYVSNNRVKQLQVTYAFTLEERDHTGTEAFIFDLEETLEMQYLELPYPVPISQLTLTIQEVYPGSRWDDSCIAEVAMETVELTKDDLARQLPK